MDDMIAKLKGQKVKIFPHENTIFSIEELYLSEIYEIIEKKEKEWNNHFRRDNFIVKETGIKIIYQLKMKKDLQNIKLFSNLNREITGRAYHTLRKEQRYRTFEYKKGENVQGFSEKLFFKREETPKKVIQKLNKLKKTQ